MFVYRLISVYFTFVVDSYPKI